MVRGADWVLPRGSFLAEPGKERERGIKPRSTGCFLRRANEGIKKKKKRTHRLGLFFFYLSRSKPTRDWLINRRQWPGPLFGRDDRQRELGPGFEKTSKKENPENAGL